MDRLLVLVLLASSLGCSPAASTSPKQAVAGPSRATTQLDAKVLEKIDALVDSSLWNRDRVFKIVCEEWRKPGELDENSVRLAIDSSIDRWRTSHADWPELTDCDRLDQAFAKLNELGVVSVHNAGDTERDGYDDFRGIYASHPKQDELIGYCFYHGEDLERVVRGGPLFLSFGPCDAVLERSNGPKIAQIIETELSEVGLVVEWDCRFSNRLCIPKFAWQRRSPPEAK